MSGRFTGTDKGNANLTFQDGTNSTSVYAYGVNTVQVSEGALENNGNGKVTITTGGGGGSGVSSITFGSTGLTPSTVSTGAISVSGILNVGNGGTGAANESTARNNLGLAIGSDVQAYNAGLADIAGLTPTDSNIIVGNGTNWVAESGATARTSLGVSIGSDVQAYNAGLADIAGLTPTDSNIIVGNGSNWVAESGATARTSLGALGTIAQTSPVGEGANLIDASTTGFVFFCDGSGGAVTANLPAAAVGLQFVFIRTQGTATITLSPNGGQTINGASSYNLSTTLYKAVTVISDGTEWFAIG